MGSVPGASCDHRPQRRVEKPWGYEVWFAVGERYAGKILHIDAGHELSFQYHRRKDETIYVVHGEIDLELDDELGQLQTHRHRMRALRDADLCEVSTPDLDDVVRLEDRYGRVVSPGD